MQSSTSVINRRSIYYIKKDFQRRFILVYIAIVLVGVALSGAMFYALLDKGLDNAFYRAHIGITTTGDVTRSPLIVTGISVVAVATLAVLGFTIFNSWSIGKGLYCLSEGLKSVKSGDLTVRINASRDDLVDLATTFNNAVGSLNCKIDSTKSKVNQLEQAALAIQPGNADGVDLLLSRIDSMEKELSTFKLN